MGLDLDVNKNESIFDQLLELDPEEVIAKVCLYPFCQSYELSLRLIQHPVRGSTLNVTYLSDDDRQENPENFEKLIATSKVLLV